MTGMVKKSLMSMLADWMADTIVLDLYCGTGTMGLEAISMGARRCCFAERDRSVLTRLRRNIDTLGVVDRSTVWQGDLSFRLAGWLATLGEPVDLAFIDPPYADVRRWQWEDVERMIFTPLGEHLASDGLAVLRVPGKVDCPDTLGPLVCRRQRNYGDMDIHMFGHPVP
jgi:16S rRNA (guanine966-N2)-methyltransferase